MTFNIKEQQIIKWGSENGKTRSETEQALIRFRTTGSSAQITEVEQPSFAKDLGGDIVETGKGIFEQVKGAGEEISETLIDEQRTIPEKIVGAGSQLFKGVSRAFGEGILGIGKAVLPQKAEEKIEEVATGFIENVVSSDFATDLLTKYNNLSPTQKQGVDDVLGFGEGLADLVTLGGASRLKAPLLNKAKELVEAGTIQTKKGITATKEAVIETVEKTAKVVLKKATPEEKVLDIISPKLTSKEMQRVIAENRVQRGATGGIGEKLFGSKPDLVIQTKQVQKARDTILRRIENAGELDDFSMNNRLKTEIATISNEIKAPMKEILVTPKQTTQIKMTWDKLKTIQSGREDFKVFNGKTTQKGFEAFLDSVKKTVKDETGKFRTKNMNDVWDVRKAYDNSIPNNVKQATTQSSARLQFRKEMWLENRAILNSVINDMSDGLGDVSRNAFSDMSDLYMARQNIATKSKILTKGEKGLIEKNIVKFGLSVGLGGLAF